MNHRKKKKLYKRRVNKYGYAGYVNKFLKIKTKEESEWFTDINPKKNG